MVSRSWRSHTPRTPAGEIDRPRFFSSLATRTWPQAGCSIASSTTAVLDLRRDPVLQHRLLAADLLQRQLAAFVVQLLEPVEAVAAVAHHLAGLADIAELLGQLQQADLGPDDLLFSRHGVLQCAEAGRFATPTAPRPASAQIPTNFATAPVDASIPLCVAAVITGGTFGM